MRGGYDVAKVETMLEARMNAKTHESDEPYSRLFFAFIRVTNSFN